MCPKWWLPFNPRYYLIVAWFAYIKRWWCSHLVPYHHGGGDSWYYSGTRICHRGSYYHWLRNYLWCRVLWRVGVWRRCPSLFHWKDVKNIINLFFSSRGPIEYLTSWLHLIKKIKNKHLIYFFIKISRYN